MAEDLREKIQTNSLEESGLQATFYSRGCSAAAFRPEIRPKARHSPMLPVHW